MGTRTGNMIDFEAKEHPLCNFALCSASGSVVHFQRAPVLVKTKKNTLLEQIEGGFKVVTHQTHCGLESTDAAFTFRSLCLLEQSLRFRMVPVRPGDETYAFAVLTGKNGQGLIVGDLMILRPEQIEKAKEGFECLLAFAENIAGGRAKRDVNWTPESSTKCRRLSRSLLRRRPSTFCCVILACDGNSSISIIEPMSRFQTCSKLCKFPSPICR